MNTVTNCKTQLEIEQYILQCEDKGIDSNDIKPKQIYRENGDQVCLRITSDNRLKHASLGYYERTGYTIIPFNPCGKVKTSSKPVHQGYVWDYITYSEGHINGKTIECMEKEIEERREANKAAQSKIRRYNSLAKMAGWKEGK